MQQKKYIMMVIKRDRYLKQIIAKKKDGMIKIVSPMLQNATNSKAQRMYWKTCIRTSFSAFDLTKKFVFGEQISKKKKKKTKNEEKNYWCPLKKNN